MYRFNEYTIIHLPIYYSQMKLFITNNKYELVAEGAITTHTRFKINNDNEGLRQNTNISNR